MSLIKSNSVLVAVDNSYSNSVISSETFSFLNFIQSMSLDIKTNRINHKFIGSKTLIQNQFIKPDINLNLTYLQRVDFFNENLFGFYTPFLNDEKSIFYNLFNNFKNENLYLIFSNKNDDILNLLNSSLTESSFSNYYTSSTLTSDLIIISLLNIYITSYSFSYSVGAIPLVNCSFSALDLKISNPTISTLEKLNVTKTIYSKLTNPISDLTITNTYFPTTPVVKILKANGNPVAITKESILNFIAYTNQNMGYNIVYHMKNLTYSSTFSSTNLPSSLF